MISMHKNKTFATLLATLLGAFGSIAFSVDDMRAVAHDGGNQIEAGAFRVAGLDAVRAVIIAEQAVVCRHVAAAIEREPRQSEEEN